MSTTTNETLIPKKDSQTQFYELANKHIKSLNKKYQEKAVITKAMNEKILRFLSNKNPKEFDSHFRAWCWTTFQILKIGSECLVCDLKTHKPVIVYEDMYSIYKQIHVQTAHSGRDKCIDALSVNYSWYNRKLLQIFINL
jgi:hypothetical protein